MVTTWIFTAFGGGGHVPLVPPAGSAPGRSVWTCAVTHCVVCRFCLSVRSSHDGWRQRQAYCISVNKWWWQHIDSTASNVTGGVSCHVDADKCLSRTSSARRFYSLAAPKSSSNTRANSAIAVVILFHSFKVVVILISLFLVLVLFFVYSVW